MYNEVYDKQIYGGRQLTMESLLAQSPDIIQELAAEFYRVGGKHMDLNPNSQESACFLVAFRSLSLLSGIRCLLTPETGDSWDVVLRAFMEAKDLLFTFRFDDQGIRNAIKGWFEGKNENSWRPRHKKCEELAKKLGAGETELGKRWSAFSALSHPTLYACQNSTHILVNRVTNRPEDMTQTMEKRTADYLTSLGALIVTTTFEDIPQFVPLGCDLKRMPRVEPFRLEVAGVAGPILAKDNQVSLPLESYRSK
jgi:hypothetical protein